MPECRETDCCNSTDAYHSDQNGFDSARNCRIIQILTTELPDAITDVAYSFQMSAFGGTAPFTWLIFSGALPVGLTLSSSGLISGTPTDLEEAEFEISVTDAGGNTCIAEFTLLSSSLSIDMVGYWRFETAGEDSSGNGNDLNDSSNAIFLQTGKIGNAVKFSLPGYLRRLTDPSFAYNGGGLTLCGWVRKLTDTTIFSSTIGTGNVADPYYLTIFGGVTPMTIGWAGLSDVYADGTIWTFFVGTHGIDNKLRFQSGQTSLGAIQTNATPYVPPPVVNGFMEIVTTSIPDLYIDELLLYHRVLTAEEIAHLFNAGAGRIITP